MTCTFCDYIGAGLVAVPMAAFELISPGRRSGEWVASKDAINVAVAMSPHGHL
jgi:hypothetical protein